MSKQKINSYCPVPGCKTPQPHLSNPTTAGLHKHFSQPAVLAESVKCSIVEIARSIIDDAKEGRYFAYLTRWRQPEELYHRALYILFVADDTAIPHIVSGELPNSFSAMWRLVNHTVFNGKGVLDKPQTGLNGEQFTAMDTLNSSAHVSFATMLTCFDWVKRPQFRRPVIEQHLAYVKTLCKHLDEIEKLFKAGKTKTEVLAEFQRLHNF